MAPSYIHNLRIATGILLILLIGFRMGSPLLLKVKSVNRIVAAVTENNDNETQKKAGNNAEQDNDPAYISCCPVNHLLWFTQIIHSTAYKNNYHSSWYSSIAVPPPDSYL